MRWVLRARFFLVHFRALLVDFRLDLGSNTGGVLTERLARLVARLFIANILPESRFGVSRKEAPLQSPNFTDNAARYESLFAFEPCREIHAFALFYECAKALVARVRVDAPASAAEHIVFRGFLDALLVGGHRGARRGC